MTTWQLRQFCPQRHLPLLEVATQYLNAGISIIPIATDGTKRPWAQGLPLDHTDTGKGNYTWKPFQSQFPDDKQLRCWFSSERGVAFVCGRISGGLEALDFDEPGLCEQYIQAVQSLAKTGTEYQELLDTINLMPMVETPSAGHHLWYRCPDGLEGNLKLATRIDREIGKIKTRIETRGEGGYALVPPSPPSCHPSDKTYQLRSGDLLSIPVLTPSQRTLLLNVARAFNLHIKPEHVVKQPRSESIANSWTNLKSSSADSSINGEKRPGDDFNATADWQSILNPHGWESVFEKGDSVYWRRPDKADLGISASTNFGDSDLFYVFSTNASPFDAGRAYTKFAAYTLLNHEGDFHAAAGQLVAIKTSTKTSYSTEPMQWDTLVPLEDAPRAPFPVNALPLWLGEYVNELAKSTQTPPDAAGMLVLAACATALSKKAVIQPREGWKEPLNLYAFVFLPLGSRKTEVLRRVISPITKWQSEENKRLKPDIDAGIFTKKALEKRIEQKEKLFMDDACDDANGLESDLAQLREELSHLHVPKNVRLVADDVSPEKLTGLLQENGGRMAILSAEGGLTDMMKGRYTSGAPNLDVYLKGHAGDDIYVDRIGRPSEHIENPALTLGLAVQPEVMNGLLSGPGFKGRGLLGCILYSFPKSNLGYRDLTSSPISTTVAETYFYNIQRLLSLAPALELDEELASIWLSEEAQHIFDDYCNEIEIALRPDGEYGEITDWAGKLAGATARIAGLFHLAGNVTKADPCHIPVSEQIMLSAVITSRYLGQHAKIAYAEMGMNEGFENARHIVRWIKRKKKLQFSLSELQSDLRHSLKEASKMDAVLHLLLEHGYIRELADEIAMKPGRKRSARYDVNPAVYHGELSIPVMQSENTGNTSDPFATEKDGWVMLDP